MWGAVNSVSLLGQRGAEYVVHRPEGPTVSAGRKETSVGPGGPHSEL